MPVDEVFVYGQPLIKRLTPALSMILPLVGNSVEWEEDWLTLAFAPGTGLVTSAVGFEVSGVSFVAAEPEW